VNFGAGTGAGGAGVGVVGISRGGEAAGDADGVKRGMRRMIGSVAGFCSGDDAFSLSGDGYASPGSAGACGVTKTVIGDSGLTG